jgi:hypothetical protein
MNLELLYQWMGSIQVHFKNLKKHQALGLAIFSYGVILARSCQRSKVAEELGKLGKLPSVERRLRRFLSNPRIDVQVCCREWIRWVWSCCDLPRMTILVDETKLGDRMGIMMVSLAFECRAIPLIWRCYIANNAEAYPPEGQVQMIVTMLKIIQQAVPCDTRILVQADRGIGCSSTLMKAIDQLQMGYLVRLQTSCILTTRNGSRLRPSQLVKPGEFWSGYGRLFNNSKRHLWAHVHVIWETGQKEPWCLATNDPRITGHRYAMRVWQEESFRDLKSGGWQWQTSYLKSPQRMERLVLVLAVAYAWMITQGSFVLNGDSDNWKEVLDSKQSKYSIFRVGLRFFKRMTQTQIQRIYVGLFFAPLYKLRP